MKKTTIRTKEQSIVNQLLKVTNTHTNERANYHIPPTLTRARDKNDESAARWRLQITKAA